MNLMSPSDIVGPSPVTSTGTATTEIEDEEADEVHARPTEANPAPQPQVGCTVLQRSALSPNMSQLMMLSTNFPDHVRQSASEEAVSVIHAPESFHSWVSFGKVV